MGLRNGALIIILLFTQAFAYAQAIDNTAGFRAMNAKRYMRLHYENDFFTGHDFYYTQGINLEVVNPAYGKFFWNRLLITPKNTVSNYGIALEHNGYTPSSITHSEILSGDRPFAADLFLKFFSFSNDTVRRARYTSSLSAGVIGSVASGYWMQRTIHRWLNGTVPQGWGNQIANDVILNYEARYEKNLLRSSDWLLININLNARAGTLSDKLSAGFTLMTGKLNPAIASAFGGRTTVRNEKFSFHFYFQPIVSGVGYDATMQGGVFNRNSPYTLSFSELKHITVQANYGLILNYHAIFAEYFKSAITKEFSTGTNHRWGGLRIGVKL